MSDEFDLISALSVYFLADHRLAKANGKRDADIVEAAVKGGATCVQLRGKQLAAAEQREIGRRLREVTRDHGVTFIVNDRLDLALALEADGVHLGEEDIPVGAARRVAHAVAGAHFIIGFSTAVPLYARQAVVDGADYISVGNLFGTRTKADAGPPIGLEPLTEIVTSVDVPVIGIGGVDETNAANVIRAGGVGVAVSSRFIRADDAAEVARALARRVRDARAQPVDLRKSS